MKLYYWSSEALRRFSTGDIIVMAKDLEEARVIALASFEKYLRESDGAWFSDYFKWYGEPENWSNDGGEVDDYNELLSKFKKDLEVEPIDTNGAIFVYGSE